MVTITGNNNARGNARSRGRISVLSNNVLRQIISRGFTPRELARLREVSRRFKEIINRNRTLLPGLGANYIRAHNTAANNRRQARAAYTLLLRFIGQTPGNYNSPPLVTHRRRIANTVNNGYNSNNAVNAGPLHRRQKARQFALRYT
jgi:hypothetical protein